MPNLQTNQRLLSLISLGLVESGFSIFLITWSIWAISENNSRAIFYFIVLSGFYFLCHGILSVIGGQNVIRHRVLIIVMSIMGIFAPIPIAIITMDTAVEYGGAQNDDCNPDFETMLPRPAWCNYVDLLFGVLVVLPGVCCGLCGILSIIACSIRCRCCTACYIRENPGFIIQRGPIAGITFADRDHLADYEFVPAVNQNLDNSFTPNYYPA